MKFVYIMVLIALIAVASFSYYAINYNNNQQALIIDAINTTKKSSLLAVKETAEALDSATQAIDVSVDLDASTIKQVVEAQSETTDELVEEIITENNKIEVEAIDNDVLTNNQRLMAADHLSNNNTEGHQLFENSQLSLINVDPPSENTQTFDGAIELNERESTLAEITITQRDSRMDAVNNRYVIDSSLLGGETERLIQDNEQADIQSDKGVALDLLEESNVEMGSTNDSLEVDLLVNASSVKREEGSFSDELTAQGVIKSELDEAIKQDVDNTNIEPSINFESNEE